MSQENGVRGFFGEVASDFSSVFSGGAAGAMVASALVFIALYAVLYPPFFEGDGRTYLAEAALFLKGKVSEPDPFHAYNLRHIGQAYSSFYPPGQSLWLALFLLGGNGFVYLSGLVAHLLAWLAFALVLKRLSIKPVYSVFYLFFPPLVYYSRTLMSEPLTMLLLLSGLYAFLLGSRGGDLAAGLLWGASVWARITNPLVFLPFLAWRFLTDRASAARVLFPVLLSGAALLAFNYLALGLLNPYSAANEISVFSFSNAGLVVKYLAVSLAGFLPGLSMQYFFYPALLAGLVFARPGFRGPAAFSFALSVLFFGFYGAEYARYIVPAAVLLLPGYLLLIERAAALAPASLGRFAVPAFLVLVAAVSFMTVAVNQYNLLELEHASQLLYGRTSPGSLVVGGDSAEKLMFSGFGDRAFLKSGAVPAKVELQGLTREFSGVYYADANYEYPRLDDPLSRLGGTKVSISVIRLSGNA